jgi:hypothetical protein
MGLRCFLQTQEKNLIFVYIDVFWFGRDTKKMHPKTWVHFIIHLH